MMRPKYYVCSSTQQSKAAFSKPHQGGISGIYISGMKDQYWEAEKMDHIEVGTAHSIDKAEN